MNRLSWALGPLFLMTASCDGPASPESPRSGLLVDRAENARAAIQRVLQADEAAQRLGDPRRHAEAIAAIDLSDTPPDFRELYIRYVVAVTHKARIADRLAQLPEEAAGARATLRASLLRAEQLSTEAAADHGRIARRHGAFPAISNSANASSR